jgi:L-fucose isomerase-like protein
MDERASQYLAGFGAVPGYEFAVIDPESDIHPGDVTVLVVLSGGTESSALKFIARTEGPVLMLAHPADNALAAALEILAFIRAQGRSGRVVQASPGWQDELYTLLRLASAHATMRRAAIGVIGARDVEVMSPRRLASEVRRVWGPRLEFMDVEDLVDAVDSADPARVEEAARELSVGASAVVEPTPDVMLGAARVYVGLRDIVDARGLAAVAVKCFDLLSLIENTGCYALARLNEEGVPAACEADILSAVGMLLLHAITGQPSFMANPSSIDPRTGKAVFAHCTIARTMTGSYVIRSHYESGIGVGIEGRVAPGDLTIARIGGRALDEVMAARARLVECGSRADLCRTQLTLEFNDPADAEGLLFAPLGNHHLVVAGDWVEMIETYVSLYARRHR